LRVRDTEVFAQSRVINAAFDISHADGHTVFLTTVIALAVLVGDGLFEDFALGGQDLDLRVIHCEGIDVIGDRLDDGGGLDGGLSCCSHFVSPDKPA